MRVFEKRLSVLSVLCFSCLVALAFPRVVEAAPIRYEFTYTSNGSIDTVPSFSFAFELPDYAAPLVLFTLPSPVTVDVGTSPGSNVVTHAGTDDCGNWVFGTSNELLLLHCSFLSQFGDGPAFIFGMASPGRPVTAPGLVTFSFVSGATQFGFSPQQEYLGRGSLTVTDLNVVPEPRSVALLGAGVASLVVRRRRNSHA